MLFKRIKDWATSITAFRTGDVIPVDGPSGTAKMPYADLLRLAAENATNVISTTYALGTFVSHNGLEYPSNTAIRTDFIESSKNLVVCPPEGYFVRGVCYYTDKTKLLASFVSSTFFDYDDDCTCAKVGGTGNYYRIVFDKISGNASASDGDNTSYFYSNDFCEQTIDYLKIKDKCRRTATMEIFDNKQHNLDDLNNARVNTTYIIQRTANTLTSNFPSDFSTDAYPSVLDTYKVFYDTNQYQVFQYLFKPNDLKLWFRTYNSYTSTWSAWTLSTERNFTTSPDQIFDNQSFNLASLNDAEPNTIKVVQRTANTATTDFPSSYPKSGMGVLVTTKTNYNPNKYQITQFLVNFDSNSVWYRTYTDWLGRWSAWSLRKGTIHVGAGQQYTRLRDAFTDAYAGTNVKVIVHPGTYDLVQEFSDVLPTINALTGCPIGHDMHVIFMSGTKVTANIDPNDYTLEQREKIVVFFEPICAKGGSYTIENLVIEATDTRYCVHDELGFSDIPYVHKYINCKMKKVTTNNVTNALYPPAIGGGLGKNGVIEIDGGVYEADISRGDPSVQSGDVEYAQQCITYHNCGDYDNAVSAISLKDVYFKNRGYFRVGDYGATLLLSKVTACGCHFGLPMLHKWETADVHDNFEIEAEWNNEQQVAGHWNVTGNTATFVSL